MSGNPTTIRLIKTWHRRIALVLGLFIAFQGITGAISQYRFWLLGASQPGYEVQASGTEASPGAVLEIVARDLPGFETAHVMYPADNARDTAVMVMGGTDPAKRMERMVTVDQYAGGVIGDKPLQSSAGWIGLANTLHKWTIFGTTGRVILTLVGLAAVALAVLGILLWWRTRKARPQSLLARIHRSAGLAVAVILLPVAVAGTVLNLFTWYEKDNGLLVTAANMREAMAMSAPVAVAVSVDGAYQSALAQLDGPHRLAAFSPAGPHARHHWFAFNSGQMRRTDVLVDPETGAIAGIKPAGLVSGGQGVRHWLFPVHSLYLVGPFGGFLAAVMGLSLSFWFGSGLVMWWRNRRPRKRAA
ncbi:PepSY-associated TM helix domain-containing protein [Altererythrobacter arenosus]|uniref:PepSY-associated TM helix domain-containing protein n=1 Tax=Altererythrobacter arenosus TaxID=3032592 RepID=A0ABY8FPZ0_9SPHN|nr:PepSY-associated TM helix domain-containing protein [Altererythrobacter sp. CAU 1644]WFL76330.1 PepSY-associated TM helix domain-containing protein [Altererythrobacter sp. CAU 1644]